jgi:hypothetical protein
MLHHVRRLIRDERGTSFEGIALSVSIIAVGFVASADVLDYMSRKHGGAIGATVRDVASVVSPSANGIDYTVTGSVRQPYVLDPCTGQRK